MKILSQVCWQWSLMLISPQTQLLLVSFLPSTFFMTVLGLHCCLWAFPSGAKSFIEVTSLVAEHGVGVEASELDHVGSAVATWL